MNMPNYVQCLWNEIQKELTARYAIWRTEIFGFGQVVAGSLRDCKKPFSDLEIFYGFVLGLLSNNTIWSNVQTSLGQPGALNQLARLFCNYDPVQFASMPPSHITTTNNWFLAKNAGSPYLLNRLKDFHKTSQIFAGVIAKPDTLDNYFQTIKGRNGTAMCLACKLGSTGSTYKLSGFGIPLAAESLKNIGYDVAKPDRHINRALASFGLVTFKKWPSKGGWDAPSPTDREFRKVMWVMDCFARAVCPPTVYIDNSIWILCAAGGSNPCSRPHLTNAELRNIAAQCSHFGSGPCQDQVSSATSGEKDSFEELDFDEFPCENCRRR